MNQSYRASSCCRSSGPSFFLSRLSISASCRTAAEFRDHESKHVLHRIFKNQSDMSPPLAVFPDASSLPPHLQPGRHIQKMQEFSPLGRLCPMRICRQHIRLQFNVSHTHTPHSTCMTAVPHFCSLLAVHAQTSLVKRETINK